MTQGDMNLTEAFEKNFHYNKLSTLMYINFTSNSTRHKVRLTRNERLTRVQIRNLIFIYKVINTKNASPRLKGDGFSEYLVARSSKCSPNPWLKSKYIINYFLYNIGLIKLRNESLKNSKLIWLSHACPLL